MATAAGAAGFWTAGAASPPSASAVQARVRQFDPPSAHILSPASATDHLSPASATDHVRLDALVGAAAAVQASAASAAARTPAPTPRQIALSLLHRFGWSARQFPPLNLLWSRESSWRVHAQNAYSGAYGIPQAVPGAKMSTAGPNWRTSARTQILWGLRYIKGRYGSPAAAWRHELATGWY